MSVRIENGADTFYVLSAEQIAVLLGREFLDFDSDSHLRTADFGLTEEDLSAYETRRALRREHSPLPMSLDAELEQQLAGAATC